MRALRRVLSGILCLGSLRSYAANAPIRVAIVGLVHGHVAGFLHALPQSSDAQLVAIIEPNAALAEQYQKRYKPDPSLFHADLEDVLSHQKVDALLVYTTIQDHRRVIEAAAKHGVSSMVEKPLCTTMDDAVAIRKAARANRCAAVPAIRRRLDVQAA